jgi:hypothetical protein
MRPTKASEEESLTKAVCSPESSAVPTPLREMEPEERARDPIQAANEMA